MSPENQHSTRCIEALKESVLFKGLDVSTLQVILKDMTLEKWKISTLKRSIENDTAAHFIVSGRLKVYQINAKTGREHTIFMLSKGDIFDILNLLDDDDHDVLWETIDTVEILKISIDCMLAHIATNPRLNEAILKYLGKRMRALEDVSLDVCLHNTLTRLAKLLLKHINGDSQKLELINNLPNDELAGLIGTTRAVLNRHIQELKKAGAISVKRKEINIENLQTLISISEEKYLS